MDANTLIQILISIVLAGVGWWVKNIWAMVIAQQQQITALQVELAKSYVPRVELQATFERIFDALEDIRKTVNKP